MNDETKLTKHYSSLGYTCLGCININSKALEAYQKSKNKQTHTIGICYYLIACHDLKVFFTMDSGD